jgi:DDE_Tnp_1-associated
VPADSVSPVSSISEVFDRWRPGERSEVMRSEFLDVLASVPDPRDPRGRRYSLMALLAIAILAAAAGMRGYAGFATWAATAPDDVVAQLGISPVRRLVSRVRCPGSIRWAVWSGR